MIDKYIEKRIEVVRTFLLDLRFLIDIVFVFQTHLSSSVMSDDEDDYVAFGVSLKPLEEGDTIRKKPIAVEEQIVRDVNGIRRFHGAFTGGFSAGHFNTVNTPQGWYPKQFKSSRETKAEKKNQRPEDFMDDEDLGEFGFAAQTLRTKSNFQRGAGAEDSEAFGSRNKRVENVLNSGGFMEQLVKPTLSTLGERLLSSQGWKPGQGIGPKIVKESKKSRMLSHIKTYGCAPASKNSSQEEEEEEDPFMDKYKEFLFAPDEIPLYLATPKENLFGIGYSGLGQTEEARNMMRGSGGVAGGYRVRTNLNFKSGSSGGKKFSISGEAFGIGADEEDDDMEVYNKGDMAQYDFSLDLREEARKERREDRESRWSEENSLKNDEHIEGFSPATSKSMIKKHFPSTRPPLEWRPKSNPTQQRQSRFSPATSEPKPPTQSEKKSRWDNKQSSSNPTIDQRRSKLFPDECNQSKSQSVPKDKLEIDSKPPTLPEFLQNFKPDSGMSLSSFKPFARDEGKQKRYDQYLICIENNRRDALSLLQPKSMTEWEKEREKVEFERASMLFKPMKGVIGSRFVSAGASEDTDVDKGLSTENEEAKTLRKAADMKMFGKLTRSTEDWHPARILCVRFNVPHPYGDYNTVGTRSNQKKETGVTNVFAMLESDAGTDKQEKEQTADKTEDGLITDVKEEVLETKILVEDSEPVKPPADLFKAIFLDSESDGSDTEKEEETEKVSEAKQPASLPVNKLPVNSQNTVSKPWEEKEGNILRNKEPARGIFANIDLDSLNRRKLEKQPDTKEKAEVKTAKGSTGDISVINQTVRTVLGIRNEAGESSSEEEFGPALPQSMIETKSSIVISSDSSEDGWVDRDKVKKKKKKKDNKKHKDRKSAKKKKKKYSSSRSRSRSRSSERNEDKIRHDKKKKKKSKY